MVVLPQRNTWRRCSANFRYHRGREVRGDDGRRWPADFVGGQERDWHHARRARRRAHRARAIHLYRASIPCVSRRRRPSTLQADRPWRRAPSLWENGPVFYRSHETCAGQTTLRPEPGGAQSILETRETSRKVWSAASDLLGIFFANPAQGSFEGAGCGRGARALQRQDDGLDQKCPDSRMRISIQVSKGCQVICAFGSKPVHCV